MKLHRVSISSAVAAAVLLVASIPGANAQEGANADLTTRALAILKQRCYACHGVENYEPGLDVLDRASLVADRGPMKTRYVLAGKPIESKLWEVINAETMPKGDPPLPADEKAVIKQWIEDGAAFPVANIVERPFISNLDLLQTIQNHLHSRPRDDRPFLRFLTLTHLHNQRTTVTAQQLRLARGALSKAVNSLSRSSEIVLPKAIDPHGTIFVIDLRKLSWTADLWKKVLAAYPYGLRPRGVDESSAYDDISDVFGVDFEGITHVRGDWFTVTAMKPPLYHDLLGLPDNLAELDKSIRVDRTKDFDDNRLVRGAVVESGVSAQNRVVDVHPSDRGLYWISYDFDRNSGRGNVTRFPLGPLVTDSNFADQAFEQAGSEIIFELQNHLHGYLLVDKSGKRINAGPISIVFDATRASGNPEIVNGLSCVSCHKHGTRDFTDVIGSSHGLQNPAALRKAKQLFDNDEMQAKLAQGRTDYMRALEKTIGPFLKADDDKTRPIEQFPEPVSTIAKQYDRDLSLEAVSSELGISDPQILKTNLQVVTLKSLGLGPLERGKTIKRSMWSAQEGGKSAFQEAAQALNIGQAVVISN